MLPNLVVLHLTLLGFFDGAAQLEYLVGDGVDKRIDALARKSAEMSNTREASIELRREFIAARQRWRLAHLFLQAAHSVFGAGNVDFVGNHDARALRQFIGVHRKLVVDDAVIFNRVAAFPVAPVMSTTCTMSAVRSIWRKEFMAQALALVSAFDKARNVGHDEVVLVALHATPRFGTSVVNG